MHNTPDGLDDKIFEKDKRRGTIRLKPLLENINSTKNIRNDISSISCEMVTTDMFYGSYSGMYNSFQQDIKEIK